jgi:hypothetical protein
MSKVKKAFGLSKAVYIGLLIKKKELWCATDRCCWD